VIAGALSLAALAVTRRLHRGYVATLEGALHAGKVRLDPDQVLDSTTRLTLAHLDRTPSIGWPTPPPRSLRTG